MTGRSIYRLMMNLLSAVMCLGRTWVLRWTMKKDGKVKKFVDGQKNILQHIAETLNRADDNRQTPKRPNDQTPICWVHVSSLGEYGAGRPVVKALQDKGFRVVLTVFSSTAYDVLSRRSDAADHVFYLPLDTRRNARRFLDIVKPQRAVFIISDYWINYLTELGRRHIPTFFTSMHVPATTYLKKWYAAPLRTALAESVTMMMVLSDETEQTLRTMGFSRIMKVGDPLFDNAILIARTPYSNSVVEAFCRTAKTIFMAGSISDDHDLSIVSDVANRRGERLRVGAASAEGIMKFIMVPHEISEPTLVRIAERCNGQALRYSQCTADTDFSNVQVLIIDYVGDLVRLYRYAHYSYVGGGFTPLLHSIIEPVVYGVPVTFGPNIHRKATPRQMIDRGFAAIVRSGDDLEAWLQAITTAGYDSVRHKALDYISENGGATQTICEVISTPPIPPKGASACGEKGSGLD